MSDVSLALAICVPIWVAGVVLLAAFLGLVVYEQ